MKKVNLFIVGIMLCSINLHGSQGPAQGMQVLGGQNQALTLWERMHNLLLRNKDAAGYASLPEQEKKQWQDILEKAGKISRPFAELLQAYAGDTFEFAELGDVAPILQKNWPDIKTITPWLVSSAPLTQAQEAQLNKVIQAAGSRVTKVLTNNILELRKQSLPDVAPPGGPQFGASACQQPTAAQAERKKAEAVQQRVQPLPGATAREKAIIDIWNKVYALLTNKNNIVLAENEWPTGDRNALHDLLAQALEYQEFGEFLTPYIARYFRLTSQPQDRVRYKDQYLDYVNEIMPFLFNSARLTDAQLDRMYYVEQGLAGHAIDAANVLAKIRNQKRSGQIAGAGAGACQQPQQEEKKGKAAAQGTAQVIAVWEKMTDFLSDTAVLEEAIDIEASPVLKKRYDPIIAEAYQIRPLIGELLQAYAQDYLNMEADRLSPQGQHAAWKRARLGVHWRNITELVLPYLYDTRPLTLEQEAALREGLRSILPIFRNAVEEKVLNARKAQAPSAGAGAPVQQPTAAQQEKIRKITEVWRKTKDFLIRISDTKTTVPGITPEELAAVDLGDVGLSAEQFKELDNLILQAAFLDPLFYSVLRAYVVDNFVIQGASAKRQTLNHYWPSTESMIPWLFDSAPLTEEQMIRLAFAINYDFGLDKPLGRLLRKAVYEKRTPQAASAGAAAPAQPARLAQPPVQQRPAAGAGAGVAPAVPAWKQQLEEKKQQAAQAQQRPAQPKAAAQPQESEFQRKLRERRELESKKIEQPKQAAQVQVKPSIGAGAAEAQPGAVAKYVAPVVWQAGDAKNKTAWQTIVALLRKNKAITQDKWSEADWNLLWAQRDAATGVMKGFIEPFYNMYARAYDPELFVTAIDKIAPALFGSVLLTGAQKETIKKVVSEQFNDQGTRKQVEDIIAARVK